MKQSYNLQNISFKSSLDCGTTNIIVVPLHSTHFTVKYKQQQSHKMLVVTPTSWLFRRLPIRPSVSIDSSVDEAICPTAAAGIYDARHPVSSRKHITFMEVGALIRRLFRDLWARPIAAGSKTHPGVTTSIRCLTADSKEPDVFISCPAYLPKYTQRLNNIAASFESSQYLIIKQDVQDCNKTHWFILKAEGVYM